MKKKNSGQSMLEYVLALFLCALVAAGTFKTFQKALSKYYDKLTSWRTGTKGIGP